MQLVSYRGNPLNSGPLKATITPEGIGSLLTQTRLRSLAGGGRGPRRLTSLIQERSLTLTVWAPGVPWGEPFRRLVFATFAPGQGLGDLVAQREDAAELVTIRGEVVSVTFDPKAAQATVTLVCPDPAWIGSTPQTVSGTTLSVTVSGNTDAAVSLIIPATTGQAGRRTRFAVVDQGGQGLAAYPVLLPVTGAAWVIANGLALPFQSTATGTWVVCDVPPHGQTLIDVYHGGIPAGPLANTLALGIDPDQSTNLRWVPKPYSALLPMSQTGTVHRTRTYPHSQQRDYVFTVGLVWPRNLLDRSELFIAYNTFGYQQGSDPQTAGQRPHPQDDVDSETVLGPVAAVTLSGRLGTPSAPLATRLNTDGEPEEVFDLSARLVLLARVEGSPFWQEIADQWTRRAEVTPFTFTQVACPPGTVQVAVCLQPTYAQAVDGIRTLLLYTARNKSPASVETQHRYASGGYAMWTWGALDLDPARVPGITTVADVPARYVPTLTVTGPLDTLTFTDLLADAEDLVFDCLRTTLEPPAGPVYLGGFTATSPMAWLRLPPGAQTVTASQPITLVVTDRWLM